MAEIVLHHFLYSHFNEKARWALAYKNVAHRRVGVIPGAHAGAMRKLTGKTMTPVMVVDGQALGGSAAIIDRLESLVPEPALYPVDPDERRRALAWQARVDEELGPDTRSIVWGTFLDHPRYTARLFGRDLNPLFQFAYAQVAKRKRELVVKINKVTPENIARARGDVARMLDEIAAAVADTGYLVGSSFSVADLAAASLLSPLLRLQFPDMRRPEPMPGELVELLDEYAPHPAIAWAQTMFDRHRPSG